MRPHIFRAALLSGFVCLAPIIGGTGAGVEILEAYSPVPHGANSDATSTIVDGSKVTVLYTATVAGSPGIDYGNVSEFVQGRHEILPALEQKVIGMKVGEEKNVELSPEESFGPHDDGKTLNISATLLPPGTRPGDVLQNELGEFATVAELSDTTAILDYNHPLAGKPLVVNVKVLKVENP